jgi:tubulin monoglycylase TTLL3/8
MLEFFPIIFNRSGHQNIIKQLSIKKETLQSPDFKDSNPKALKKNPSNEYFELKTSTRSKYDHKKPESEEHRKKKFEQRKLDLQSSIESNGFIINIEKKQIIERSPETEKKNPINQKTKNHSGFKTFYTKKKFSRGIQQLSSQVSMASIPRQFNSYDVWKLNNNISIDKKVFIICGNYPDVRKAFLQRGWIENADQESIYFDLKWARNARVPSNMLDWQIYNHFPKNFELSVKWQLYENIKKAQSQSKVSYLNYIPRCFRLDSKGTEDFFDTFKAIFAISLLRDFILTPSKQIIEQVVIANIICKRWIQDHEKNNNCTERVSGLVMNVEWRILTSKDILEIKSCFQRMMLSSSQDLYTLTKNNLEKVEELDPQFFINGYKNIWIVKAGRKSRGRDIAVFNDLNKLKSFTGSSGCWVVQKYIENPLIIFQRKFDIRQWVLITNSDPLTVWVYKKSYLRFSLENYSDDNLSNPFIHLTNNSISKTSKKFDTSEIKGCMWSIEQFQDYLITEKKSNLWASHIFPGIKKIVKYSLLAIGNLGRKNSFEILGYDFMIDNNMKPWLLEINSSPAMDYSTVIAS